MISCTKIYRDIPFAHRQHNHDGHCSLIHGHNWGFEFTFTAEAVDENGFVVDFGKLQWLKLWLDQKFDHKLLLNEEDPYLPYLTKMLCDVATVWDEKAKRNFVNVTIVPNCGAEGIASYLLEMVGSMVQLRTKERKQGQVFLSKVVVWEDSKNYATAKKEEFENV